jgi:hypothetical protein
MDITEIESKLAELDQRVGTVESTISGEVKSRLSSIESTFSELFDKVGKFFHLTKSPEVVDAVAHAQAGIGTVEHNEIMADVAETQKPTV